VRWQRIGLLLAGSILALTLLECLTPPWEYDGLMYHLQGPRLFLQAGRIELLPDNWQANGPATTDMLFTLGLSFGSDTFAKLVHLTYAVLLIAATFAFGQRYLKPHGGWLASAILLGIPSSRLGRLALFRHGLGFIRIPGHLRHNLMDAATSGSLVDRRGLDGRAGTGQQISGVGQCSDSWAMDCLAQPLAGLANYSEIWIGVWLHDTTDCQPLVSEELDHGWKPCLSLDLRRRGLGA